jgi:hypothetical protein
MVGNALLLPTLPGYRATGLSEKGKWWATLCFCPPYLATGLSEKGKWWATLCFCPPYLAGYLATWLVPKLSFNAIKLKIPPFEKGGLGGILNR